MHDRDADERVYDNDDAQEDSVTEYGVNISTTSMEFVHF
jgi:hypothetical protein